MYHVEGTCGCGGRRAEVLVAKAEFYAGSFTSAGAMKLIAVHT
jgi:hypothetical protein